MRVKEVTIITKSFGTLTWPVTDTEAYVVDPEVSFSRVVISKDAEGKPEKVYPIMMLPWSEILRVDFTHEEETPTQILN